MNFSTTIRKYGPCGLHILAAAFFLFNTTHTLFDFPLDDSWIHQVYARSIAWGQGLAYNTGELEAGSTSPLWSIINAPLHWGDMLWGPKGVVFLAKLLGLSLACIAIRSGMRLIEIFSNNKKLALYTSLLWAIDPRFVYSSLSGMENNLLLALWMGGTLLFASRRYLGAFLLFSLMPVTRPEGLVIVPLSLLAYYWMERGALNPRRWMGYACFLLIPVALWVGFCLRVTGHPLPNTFYVKAVSSGLTLRSWVAAYYIVSSQGFLASFLLCTTGLAGLIFAIRKAKWTRSMAAALLLLPGAAVLYLGGTIISRELDIIGYYFSRWLDPPALLLTWLVCLGLCLFFETVLRQERSLRKTALVTLLASAILLGSPVFFLSTSERRRVYSQDCRAIYTLDVLPGKWLAEHTPKGSSVAVEDAGATRYFSNRYILDLHGLNSKEKAFEHPLPKVQWLVLLGVTPPPPAHLAQPVERFFVPAEEYSITGNAAQREFVIYEVIDRTQTPTP